MIDPVTLGVMALARSIAFYDRALKPLGIERLASDGAKFAGYGEGKRAFFWIGPSYSKPSRASAQS